MWQALSCWQSINKCYPSIYIKRKNSFKLGSEFCTEEESLFYFILVLPACLLPSFLPISSEDLFQILSSVVNCPPKCRKYRVNTKINDYQHIIIRRSSSSFGTPQRQWRIYVKSKQQTIPMSVWGGRNDYHGNAQTTCLLPALWKASPIRSSVPLLLTRLKKDDPFFLLEKLHQSTGWKDGSRGKKRKRLKASGYSLWSRCGMVKPCFWVELCIWIFTDFN